MITLFENFNDNTTINLEDYIKNGKIPVFDFNKFGTENPDYFTNIRYNTLMRFYLYMKFLKYKGTNRIILNYIDGLKNKDQYRMEIINKIPNNNHILEMINQKFKLNYPNYSYDNLEDLQNFIDNYESILSDQSLVEYLEKSKSLTDKAKASEKIIRGVMVMLYGRYYNIQDVQTHEDLKGIDLWMINKETGEKSAVQIKNVSVGATFRMLGDVIYIENTGIDLHKYESWKNQRLPYDYLVFYLEESKKACIIKTSAIFAIDRPSRRRIRIKLKDWAFKYKTTFKLINVPKRLLPKDYSKIFY